MREFHSFSLFLCFQVGQDILPHIILVNDNENGHFTFT